MLKKILALVICAMLLGGSALAMDMGVQLISGPETEVDPVNLDDIKLDVEIPIEGYGTLKFYEYQVIDKLVVYQKGSDWYTDTHSSGVEAQYVLLKMDVINTTVEAKKFGSTCEVKVFYDEVFEYGGWNYQYNWNNRSANGATPKTSPMNPADNFAISPMYQGHYCFGCTLPNAVFDSEAPMKMVIKLDDHEITYHIRREEATVAN